MATSFKPQLVLREANKQGEFNIKIRVSHNRKTRYIRTQFYIKKENFNNNKGEVKDKQDGAAILNLQLSNKISEYKLKIIEVDPEIDIKLLLDILKNKDKNIDFKYFFIYTQNFIEKYKLLEKNTTAELFFYTLVSIKKFIKTDRLLFKDINYKFLSDYETFLLSKGLKINAVSVYLRNIRKMFIEAKKEYPDEITHYPFVEFKIRTEKTIKRNLPIDVIKALKNAQLTGKQAYARDIFMLSFYLIGINFKDLYQANTIIDNRLAYRRAKNRRLYNILLLPEAKKIIKQYPGKNTLLNCCEIYKTVHNFRRSTNKFIKQIAEEMELNYKPTTYYARHTWATIASKIKIDRDTISHALGHGIDGMTDIYINFDMDEVDKANKKVAKAID